MNAKKIALAFLFYVVIPGGTAFLLYKSIMFIARRIKRNPKDLSPSSQLIEKIKQWESGGKGNLPAYNDGNGILHIGYGHNLAASPAFGITQVGQTITDAQAEALLDKDVNYAAQAVKDLVTVNLSQNQFDALTDIVFGMGKGKFETTELLTNINNGNSDASIKQELLLYNKDTSGVAEPGLVARANWRAGLYSMA